MFSEYQLSIDRASPFEKTTIVVGYTNGCIGYVPTENEYSFGGYECCHSFRVYGRSTDISPTSERVIMHTTMSMLHGLKYNYHTMPVSMLQDAVKHKRQTPFANRFAKKGVLVADTFESHFPLAHDTYNAMGVDAQNKYVYYVLSSESMAGARTGARLYRVPCSSRGLDQMHSRFVDPKDQGGGVEELGDLTIAMQDPLNCVVQGKSHVPLIDCGAALGIVFGTHVGYYSFVDGMETLPQPKDLPSHVKPYPGGGVLSFIPDSNKGTFQVHARVPDGEGVLTMAVDPTRKRAYYLTWPSGKFGTTALYTSQADHDAKSVEEHTLANTLFEYKGRGQGESVHPSTGLYRCVCRSMVRTRCLLFLLVVVLFSKCNGVSSFRVSCFVVCVLNLFLFCVHLYRCVVALGRGPQDRACVLVQCGWRCVAVALFGQQHCGSVVGWIEKRLLWYICEQRSRPHGVPLEASQMVERLHCGCAWQQWVFVSGASTEGGGSWRRGGRGGQGRRGRVQDRDVGRGKL